MSIEAAVRKCIMGGMGLMQEQISQQNHDDLGCDGWEISAHGGSATDHEPIQGKQYSDKAYKRLNDSLKRRIGTLNCGHAAFPIIMGVNEPVYTEAELAEFREENEKGVTFDGKHYTLYEATQRQRKFERSIRKQKSRILVDKATEDTEKLQTDQIRLVRLRQEYARFSKGVDLPMQHERAEVAGFTWKDGKTAESTYKTIAKQANLMYDIDSTEENIAAWQRDQPIRKRIGTEEFPLSLHAGRQNKHVPGTHEYKQYQQQLAAKNEFGPARLTVDETAVRALVDKYHGTGILLKHKDGSWAQKERITMHPDVVGVSVNNITGAEAETTTFTIHYSKKGVHIVPDYPSRKGDKAKQ